MLVGCRPLDPHLGQFEQIAVDSHETTDRLQRSQLPETGLPGQSDPQRRCQAGG